MVSTMASDDGVSSQVLKFLNNAVTPSTTIPAPVSPSYCVQNYAQILFMKWENWMSRGSKITVCDAQEQIEFHASREFNDLHTKGTIRDQSENVIVSLKKKISTTSNKWAAYRGEDEIDSDFSVTVVREELDESNATFGVFLTENRSEVPDFTVVGNVYEHNFTILYRKSVVAKVIKSPLYKKNECKITIYRGMDKAFTASLLLIIDQQQEEEKYVTGAAAFWKAQLMKKNDTTRTAALSGVQQEEEEDDSTETAVSSDAQEEVDPTKSSESSDALPVVPVSSCAGVTNLLTQYIVMRKNRFLGETVIPYFISLASRYTAAQEGYNSIVCYEFPHQPQQQTLPAPSWTTMADSVPQLPFSSPFRTIRLVLAVIVSMMILISLLGVVIFTMAALVNVVMGMMMVVGMVLGASLVLGVGVAVIVGVVTGTPPGFMAGGDTTEGVAELNVRKFTCRFSYHLSTGRRLGMVELRYKKFTCNLSCPL